MENLKLSNELLSLKHEYEKAIELATRMTIPLPDIIAIGPRGERLPFRVEFS